MSQQELCDNLDGTNFQLNHLSWMFTLKFGKQCLIEFLLTELSDLFSLFGR